MMAPSAPIEVWGGLECTIARVGERYRDEVIETGHSHRPEDLDRIAALGIRTLRYPILWEAVKRDGAAGADWSWHDERLRRIRDLGIRPIAGLIHHGSGPRSTNLLDPEFPKLFARHAAATARRYPFIDLWTPVNEPLTTARFSALYGHWFPHERGYGPLLRALVNQCRATVLAMRAIRRENPAAQLIQTDDVGRVFSTPALADQAAHENDRRWLTFDLLFGRVDRHHPWWSILVEHGIAPRELDFLRNAGVAPDMIGVNHYLTSERFLDERLALYPAHLHGGNGRDVYADVEAVRVPLPADDLGPAARLREVWERYRTPIAVTEVHHGSTRDEQLRWLREVWRAARTVRQEGADIRAVTVWALFGTVDWNALLTREDRIYEPGAFDIRAPEPRPTALATAAASLAERGDFDHPVLDRPGWWHRGTRFYQRQVEPDRCEAPVTVRDLLVVDGGTAIGAAFTRVAEARGIAYRVLPPTEALAAVARRDGSVWAVADLCRATGSSRTSRGAGAPDLLWAACREGGVRLLGLSTGDVFGESLDRPALECDEPTPADGTDRTALGRENRMVSACPSALVVRTGSLFGPWDRDNFLWRMLADLSAGRLPANLTDDVVTATYLPDLVHVALDLLIDDVVGIRHLVSPGDLRARQLAGDLAHRVGLTPPPWADDTGDVRRRSLETQHGNLLPPLASALDRYLRECGDEWRAPPATLGIAAE